MPLYVQLKQTLLLHYYRRLYWFQRLSMNQRLVIILLPILFTAGTILYFRSYQTSNLITIVSDQPVRVDFFVMSRCPDARKCELLFVPTLLKLSTIINFTVSYIAYGSSPDKIQCMHGEEECHGNKQQLCVQNMCSQTTLLKFLQCQSENMNNIPNNGEKCVEAVSDGTLKWSDIETCMKTNKANELLFKSIEKTRSAMATKSCTIHLNGKFWCMHDGTWYGCNEGRDEKSLIKAICSRYNGPNKPTDCATISV